MTEKKRKEKKLNIATKTKDELDNKEKLELINNKIEHDKSTEETINLDNEETIKESLFNETEPLEIPISDKEIINIDTMNPPVPNMVKIEDLPKVDIEIPKPLDKKQLINKINQFLTQFPNIHIQRNIPKHLHKMTVEDLLEITSQQEQALKGQSSHKMLTTMFFHLSSTVENILVSNTEIDLTGMTEQLKKQENEIELILSQLTYEYMETIEYFSSPELRLGLIVIMAGMSSYSRNKMKKAMIEKAGDDPVKLAHIDKLFNDNK